VRRKLDPISVDEKIRCSPFFVEHVRRVPVTCVPQDRQHLQIVLGNLITDASFRKSFGKDPERAVAKLGLVLTPFEYATADALQRRLDSVADVDGTG
jgi:hypothetical protein